MQSPTGRAYGMIRMKYDRPPIRRPGRTVGIAILKGEPAGFPFRSEVLRDLKEVHITNVLRYKPGENHSATVRRDVP